MAQSSLGWEVEWSCFSHFFSFGLIYTQPYFSSPSRSTLWFSRRKHLALRISLPELYLFSQHWMWGIELRAANAYMHRLLSAHLMPKTVLFYSFSTRFPRWSFGAGLSYFDPWNTFSMFYRTGSFYRKIEFPHLSLCKWVFFLASSFYSSCCTDSIKPCVSLIDLQLTASIRIILADYFIYTYSLSLHDQIYHDRFPIFLVFKFQGLSFLSFTNIHLLVTNLSLFLFPSFPFELAFSPIPLFLSLSSC